MQRGWMEHPALDAPGAFSRREAYAWLIEEASWKRRKVNVSGHTVTLQRGQLAHSGRFMAKAWDWSEPTVRQFLTRLEADGLITRANTYARRKVITLCEYDQIGSADDEPDAESSHNPRTNDANEKERKNGKGEKFRKATPSGARQEGEAEVAATKHDAQQIAAITGLSFDDAMDLLVEMYGAAEYDDDRVRKVIGAATKAHSRGTLRSPRNYLLAAAAQRDTNNRAPLEVGRHPDQPSNRWPPPTHRSGERRDRRAGAVEFEVEEDDEIPW